MKKALTLIVACALLSCLTACSGTRFESQDAIFIHLDGMWLENDGHNERSYYIFKNGQVYCTNDWDFKYKLENYMDSVLANDGVVALTQLDFQTVIDVLDTEDILPSPKDNVQVDPKKGRIILDKGMSFEKHIVIAENSAVIIKDADESSSTTLTKLSDEVDFSGEHFSQLFDEAKKNYKISARLLLPTPEEYTSALKLLHPYINNWILVSQEESATLYTVDGNLTNSGGSLIIGNDSVFFSEGKPISGKGSPLVVDYRPEGDLNWNLFISDRRYTDLSALLKYSEPVLKVIPGTLSTPELLSLFEKEKTVSGGARQFETTVNDITYKIIQSANNETTVIYMSIADNLRIPVAEELDSTGAGSADNSQKPGLSLAESLDFSKVWGVEWVDPYGDSYEAYYAFEEDGTCYMIISAYGTEIIADGKGTYKVDGEDVTFSLESDGMSLEYSYHFESEKLLLTQVSKKGLAYNHNQGDSFQIRAVQSITINQIKERFGDSSNSSSADNTGSSGNTSDGGSTAGNGNTSQQPTMCSHSYSNATCTTPQTCTKCGAINGTVLGHTYSNATCTTPQSCTRCGATAGSAAGHTWKSATCTHPETCSVCNYTQGDALGHNMGLTKCSRCDYTDYITIAKTYSNITAYDSKTGQDLIVTDVSVNNSGVLSFTFNGKSYSITIMERQYGSMTYFDCYQDGRKLTNAECRIGDASYYNMLHLEWNGVDGYRLYFCTGKQ